MKTLALTALIALTGTAALAGGKAAAPEWRTTHTLEAMSSTAMGITGDISFYVPRATEDGKDTLVAKLGETPEMVLKSLGKPKGWKGDAVELFTVAGDPGKLLQGNTLCGADKATFAALTQTGRGKDATVELAVYSTKKAPKSHDVDGLCGTFSYTPKAGK